MRDRMTEKDLSDGFDHIRDNINELQLSLCKFMADLILEMPIGLNYDDWRKLHLMKGDWE